MILTIIGYACAIAWAIVIAAMVMGVLEVRINRGE